MRLEPILVLVLFLVFPLNGAFPYLFTGLSIKVDTFSEKPIDGSIVFIELCKGKVNHKDLCLDGKEVIDCKKNTGQTISGIPYQWECLTEESLPFRLGIKHSGKLSYASESFLAAVNTTQDRYSLYLENNRIESIYLPIERLFYIGMQQMLENVFHPSMVQKIRALDKTPHGKFWQVIDKPETSFTLKVCQHDKCYKGQKQEISCSFSTMGITGMAYQCSSIPGYARFAEITLKGLDKTRKTEFFRMEQKRNGSYHLNYIFIKADSLELRSDKPPST